MNIIKKYTGRTLWLAGIMLTTLLTGCGGSSGTSTTDSLVAETAPVNEVENVGVNSKVFVTFSEEMNAETITDTSFTVSGPTLTALDGTVSYDVASKTASFTLPVSRPFAINTLYTATVTTAVKSTVGISMATDYVWSFTTGTTADTDAPTVSSVEPLDNAIDVILNRSVSATFSEAIDRSTVTASTFTLSAGGNLVSGVFRFTNHVATFDPASDLASNTVYIATLTSGITDTAGNELAATPWTWSFETGSTNALGPDPVNLGTAGDFVILAKTAISKDSNVDTLITGDIGVSPAARTFITGFSETMDASNEFATSTYVVGNIYAADLTPPTPAKMTTAVSDMQTAYTDAAGRPTPDYLNFGSGEIGGKILSPGLYKWGTDVSISTNVTLKGDMNDVWIFQIDGNITQAGTADIILDGALAKNIFWQIAGETVFIGTGASFHGVVLAQKQINVKTGATVNGRLLSQTQVTLEGNAVTQP